MGIMIGLCIFMALCDVSCASKTRSVTNDNGGGSAGTLSWAINQSNASSDIDDTIDWSKSVRPWFHTVCTVSESLLREKP